MTLPLYWSEFRGQYAPGQIDARPLRCSDGYLLRVFELGRGHEQTLLIVNPLATTFLLLLPLASLLAQRYRVVSWESRGAPFLDDPLAGRTAGVDRQARDLHEIAEHLELRNPHVLTWCSGSMICAWAAANLAIEFASVCMLCPDRVSYSTERTLFQTAFIPQLMRIADDFEAGLDVSQQCAFLQQVTREAHERRGFPTLIRQFTSLPYRTTHTVRDYCVLVRDFERSVTVCPGPVADPVQLFRRLQARTRVLLLHCMDDPTMDYRCTVEALEECTAVSLAVYARGGHFVAFSAPHKLLRDIGGFIEEGSEPQGVPAAQVRE